MEKLIVWYDANEDVYCVNIGLDSAMPEFQADSLIEAMLWATGYKAAHGNAEIIVH